MLVIIEALVVTVVGVTVVDPSTQLYVVDSLPSVPSNLYADNVPLAHKILFVPDGTTTVEIEELEPVETELKATVSSEEIVVDFDDTVPVTVEIEKVEVPLTQKYDTDLDPSTVTIEEVGWPSGHVREYVVVDKVVTEILEEETTE